ncbi:MAG: acetyl-CoA C-acetyltransferase [Planctomycetota bacterium]
MKTTRDGDVVLLGGARTPMAEYVGTPGFGKFKDTSAIELAALALKEALKRTRVAPGRVQHVLVGNALQSSIDAIYGARHVGLKAGIPVEVPAVTVNRLCGSGIESIVQGARLVRDGEAEVVASGGMENMSQAPYVMYGAREGFSFGKPPQLQDLLFAALMDPYCGLYMAQTAEKLGAKYQISREAQDEFALRSHRLGADAVKAGRFAEEIVPVSVKTRRGEELVATDDHIKPETSLEALAKLRPAFGKDGTVTAGNASGIVDGAAAVLLTSARTAARDGLAPMARVVDWATVGVPPDIMGIGPAPAIRMVLEKAQLRLDQVDLFEINEAFSVQYLAVEKELGLDRSRVNVNGGAIALGHPLGATGTRLVLTLMYSLRRAKKRYGIASACIGGGQGIALLIEAL